MSTAAPNSQQAPLPPAVAASAELANTLQKQLINGDGGGTPPPEEVPAPATPLENQQPATHVPQQTPSQDTEWQHRYNSAMGRLQAAETRERQMVERLNSMENLLSSVAAQQAPTQSPKERTFNYSKLITDEEEKDYGDEFLQVVGKKAKDELLPEILQLQDTVKDLQSRVATVGTTIAKTGEEKVWNRLKAAVPDAETMNDDPDFLAWLGDVDPYSGVQRREMLAQAYARQDAQRVVNFFSGYKADRAAMDPQGRAPVAQPQAARPALAQYAAPGRGASSPATASEKPIYTARDLAAFYADKRVGKYKGREADADAIERDIFLAGREGRIRQ